MVEDRMHPFDNLCQKHSVYKKNAIQLGQATDVLFPCPHRSKWKLSNALDRRHQCQTSRMNHIVIFILYRKIFDRIEGFNDNKDTIEKSTK